MATNNTIETSKALPARRHIVRSLLLFVLATLVMLAIWMVYTSLTHKVV